MSPDAVAVAVAVSWAVDGSGRIALWLSGLLKSGTPRRTRTYNPRIKSPLLCQLS